MDVRIGEISATIVDRESGAIDDVTIERIARRVVAMIEHQERAKKHRAIDRRIASPDAGDVEQYG
jgi:hypothetical protein